MYAVSFVEKKLLLLDPKTAAARLVTNLTVKPYDVATYHGCLFVYHAVTEGVALSQADPETGQILRQISFPTAIVGGEGSCDFRADGLVFVTKSDGSTGTVFRLDLSRTNLTAITGAGGLTPSMDGVAFSPEGVLYGLRQGASSLYTIDPLTGATALVGSLGISFSFGGTVVGGLAFSPDGTLFAVMGGATDSNLYRLDRITGAATLVGAVGVAGLSGICFLVPPPGPLVISRQPAGFRLSWPQARAGLLQSSASPTGPWTNSPLLVTTNGVEAITLAPADARQAYYRLSR